METKGYSMKCGGHTYITLFYDGKIVTCYDNDTDYMESIIEQIEHRTKMPFRNISIVGKNEDFDGLRFLSSGFMYGWLNNPLCDVIKEVCIPACENHEGLYCVKVKLRWICPICRQPRGEVKKGFSYDGSLRLAVDTWDTPCGHNDYYEDVLNEAINNGLNNDGGNNGNAAN